MALVCNVSEIVSAVAEYEIIPKHYILPTGLSRRRRRAHIQSWRSMLVLIDKTNGRHHPLRNRRERHADRHLKSPEEMHWLFPRTPAAVAQTLHIPLTACAHGDIYIHDPHTDTITVKTRDFR